MTNIGGGHVWVTIASAPDWIQFDRQSFVVTDGEESVSVSLSESCPVGRPLTGEIVLDAHGACDLEVFGPQQQPLTVPVSCRIQPADISLSVDQLAFDIVNGQPPDEPALVALTNSGAVAANVRVETSDERLHLGVPSGVTSLEAGPDPHTLVGTIIPESTSPFEVDVERADEFDARITVSYQATPGGADVVETLPVAVRSVEVPELTADPPEVSLGNNCTPGDSLSAAITVRNDSQQAVEQARVRLDAVDAGWQTDVMPESGGDTFDIAPGGEVSFTVSATVQPEVKADLHARVVVTCAEVDIPVAEVQARVTGDVVAGPETEQETWVAIDFGTSTSSVCIIQEDHPTEPVPVLIDQEELMPSVISFVNPDTPEVGQKAKGQMSLYPDRTFKSIKTRMSEPEGEVFIDGVRLYVYQLAGHILHKMVTETKDHLDNSDSGGGGSLCAVMTVPANAPDSQRKKTILAAKQAGLDTIVLQEEPSVAAMTAVESPGEQMLLMVDVGGGTTDVALIWARVNSLDGLLVPERIEVQSVHGDNKLGGDDFDALLARYLVQNITGRDDIELPDRLPVRKELVDKYPVERQTDVIRTILNLFDEAERMKREFSEADTAQMRPTLLTFDEDYAAETPIEVTYDTFKALSASHVERVVQLIKRTLDATRVTPEQLTRLVLAGGGSRIRPIREAVEDEYGDAVAIYQPGNCDQLVVRGATQYHALQATIRNRTFYAYGLKLYDTQLEDHYFECIIDRNQMHPVSGEDTLSPMGAQADIRILQGRDRFTAIEDTYELGSIHVGNLDQFDDRRIRISFDIDENGELSVDARPVALPAGASAGEYVTVNLAMERQEDRG
ncbi:MAG: Hsp70 family protein [Armatimonadota bacterium]